MIALPPVDPADFIMQAGDAMQNCFNKYLNVIPLEEAIQDETLDPKYSPNLLSEMGAEYYKELERIWDTIPSYYRSSFQAAYETPTPDVAGDLFALQKAYEDAVKKTFWEKLGKTNYKDVLAYKLLLKEYGKKYLQAMHASFINAVSKIAR